MKPSLETTEIVIFPFISTLFSDCEKYFMNASTLLIVADEPWRDTLKGSMEEIKEKGGKLREIEGNKE